MEPKRRAPLGFDRSGGGRFGFSQMSLFLGNLPAYIHQEDLERVFRRFGRCDVQLKKDGYGFAIYEVPENAERALRSLRGKQICGQNIALDWSRKQPGAFQRFPRPKRFYEPYHGRNFRDEENGERSKDQRPHRNFAMGRGRRPMFVHRGHRFDEMDYAPKDASGHREEKGPSLKERSNAGDAVDPNASGNDRWGEPDNDSSDGNGIETEADFERYEPSRGFDRRYDNENNQTPGSDGSPMRGSSPDKGHKMRNCPRGDRSRTDKFDRFERRDNEMNFIARDEGGLKRKRPTSWGRSNAGRNSASVRPHTKDGKVSQSQKPRKISRRDSSPESMGNHHHRHRRGSSGRKKSKHESGTLKKQHRKRSKRRSHSSSLHSDSVASSSRSKSQSSRSVSGISSRSRSRSVSSRSHSESSSSRSGSSLSKSRSTRSRSMSRSKTRSFSVSLDQKSSPKDAVAAIDPSAEGEALHASSPDSKQPLAANSSSELKGIFEDENAVTSSKVDVDTCEGQNAGNGCEDENFPNLNTGHKEKEPCMDLLEKFSFSYGKSSENLGDETIIGESQSERTSPQIPVRCQDNICAGMSPHEMCKVLKHYGLAAPEESKPGLTVGSYFGAARLWPWEMIYYRRLKRGPITTENYARRVAQNKEFGIADKYIRSSSGWGENK
ncbi:hypothetical protein Taro_032867 [Colocasia esculenta]|uniref:RRM domain-containing protein n=1 Tax=Colocasia esculenta TaxID=4460 RepID=A0A843VMD7_COLES|nr:hypothetical protein [Colocasia esculenta]